MQKMLLAVVSTLIVGVVGAPQTALADHPCPMERVGEDRLRAYESDLQTRANQERVSRQMPSIAPDPDITRAAREHARRMAEEGRVYHNPEYRDADRYGAAYIDEIVTRSCSPHGAHDNFMGSPAHRDALLTPEWTQGGVGVASGEQGMLYVVEAFAQPKRQTSAKPAGPVETPPAPRDPSPAAPTVNQERAPRQAEPSAPPPTPAPTATPAPEAEVRVEAAPFHRVERGPEPASPRTESDEAGFRMAMTGWWAAGLFAWSMLWALFGPGGPRKRRTRRLREPAGPDVQADVS